MDDNSELTETDNMIGEEDGSYKEIVTESLFQQKQIPWQWNYTECSSVHVPYGLSSPNAF